MWVLPSPFCRSHVRTGDFLSANRRRNVARARKCTPLETCQEIRPGGSRAPFSIAGRALCSRRRSCSSLRAARRSPSRVSQVPAPSISPGVRAASTAKEVAPAPPEPARPADPERTELVAWLRTKLPAGGEIIDAAGSPVGLAHVLRRGDSLPAIADAYVGLTDIYLARELGKAIQKRTPSFAARLPRRASASSSPPS